MKQRKNISKATYFFVYASLVLCIIHIVLVLATNRFSIHYLCNWFIVLGFDLASIFYFGYRRRKEEEIEKYQNDGGDDDF